MVGPGNQQTGNRRERKRGKEMIDFVNWLADTVLWGLPLLVLMFGTGLYFTIRSGFFQFRHFGWIWRHTAGSLFHKDVQDSADAHRAGKLSAFEAVCTAVIAMGLCGEFAHDRLSALDGNSSYRNYIIDAVYNLTAEQLKEGAKYEMR